MNMLTRLTDTLTRDAQARAAAAVAALLLGVLIGLVVLIIAGAPDKAQATPPIIVEATPTAAPVAMVAAYAAPGGAQLGDIPADTPIRYRDSRAPGWVGVDWNGGVVWFLADGDASALADLAPAPTSPPPPPIAEQPPAQVIYVERPAAAPPTADLCTPETCDPAAAPTVCAANACWSAAAPEVVYVPAFGGRNQRAAEPQSGDPGFAESFRDPQDAAFAASFRDPGCSQFIGYLPGDPCYRP